MKRLTHQELMWLLPTNYDMSENELYDLNVCYNYTLQKFHDFAMENYNSGIWVIQMLLDNINKYLSINDVNSHLPIIKDFKTYLIEYSALLFNAKYTKIERYIEKWDEGEVYRASKYNYSQLNMYFFVTLDDARRWLNNM